MPDNSGNSGRAYLQPAFLICVVVLAGAGVGTSMLTIPKKELLPLRKSLELLDSDGLGPYEILAKPPIPSEETLSELGTKDYIQWVLEDADEAGDSAVKRLLLFVTYYGRPDRVPHVPEECWAGGGFQKISDEGVALGVDNKDGFKRNIPATHLVFSSVKSDTLAGRRRVPVLYFFNVNDVYAGSRGGARLVLNKSIFDRFSYFCKVELVFNQTSVSPDREQVIAASEKLLAVILPILEERHWPDWKDALAGSDK